VPASQPKSFILDVYGSCVRQLGGWLAIAELVDIMADLGQDSQAVRSSISRMKKSGLLRAETRRGSAGYALTEQALEILDDGDVRIFHSEQPAVLADGWAMAVFSVPENEREQRHQLRSRLIWLGFGQVAPGVWIAPRRVLTETRRLLQRTGLSRYVDLFAADYAGFDEVRELVARTWDLAQLEALYRDFITEHSGTLRAWRNGGAGRRDRDAFVDYTLALSAWRRLPYRDPGLPPELLPRRWAGQRARELFAGLRTRLEPRARAHVHAATAGPRARSGAR